MMNVYQCISSINVFAFSIIISVWYTNIVIADQKNSEQKPNIVFIMSDDHASAAVGAYGSKLYNTPNIDRLAKNGMRFTNTLDVVSICSPSRASILTGKYSVHNGFRRNGDAFNGAQQTFPKLLQKAGYQTGIVGKWHLLTQPTGFDYYDVIPFLGEYFNSRFKKTGEEWKDGNKGGNVVEGYDSFYQDVLI